MGGFYEIHTFTFCDVVTSFPCLPAAKADDDLFLILSLLIHSFDLRFLRMISVFILSH